MADSKFLAQFKKEEIMSADQRKKLTDYYEVRGYTAQDVALAIVGAGLANAISQLAISGPFTFWNTIVGFFIICILLTYHPAPSSRFYLKIAFAAILSFSFLTTIGVLFNMLFDILGGSFPDTNAICFISFPASIFHKSCNPHPSTMPITTFTPFNAYDLCFFVAWIVISIICYWLFFLKGRTRTESTSLQDQLKSETETQQQKSVDSDKSKAFS